MRRAQSAFQAGNFPAAAAAFEQVIGLLPQDARAHFGLGLALASLGKSEQAHAHLIEANGLSPANPEILLALAQLETSLGRTDGARKRLMEVEKLRPQDARLGLLRVQTYLAENDASAALAEMERVSRASANTSTHEELAALLMRMRAWPRTMAEYEWIDRRDPAAAERAIQRGLIEGASSAEFRFLLLGWFQERKRLDRAVAIFQMLHRDHPNDSPLHAGLIEAHTMTGNIDLARRELRDLSERLEAGSDLRLELGRFFLASGEEDLALSQFLRTYRGGLDSPEVALQLAGLQGQAGAYTDAIEIASRVEQQGILPPAVRSAAALLLGTSSMSIGRDQEAIHHLEEAIQFSPGLEANYLALSQVYQVLGEPRKELEVLRRGKPRIVPSPEYQLALGRSLLANDEHEDAVAVLSDLIEKHSDQVEAYLPLARAYHLTNQPEHEIRTMRRLAALQPDYPMLPVMLAQSLVDAGPSEYEAALDELRKAEAAAPVDPDIFAIRAKLFQSMGRLDEAEVQFLRSIELRPTDPALRYQLALLYSRMGKEELALEQIQKKDHLESALIPDLTRSN